MTSLPMNPIRIMVIKILVENQIVNLNELVRDELPADITCKDSIDYVCHLRDQEFFTQFHNNLPNITRDMILCRNGSDQHIDKMFTYLRNSRGIEKRFRVYRGLDNNFPRHHLRVGFTFYHANFLWTSLHPEYAKQYRHNTRDSYKETGLLPDFTRPIQIGSMLLEIIIPPGVPYLEMPRHGKNSELIFEPSELFIHKIVSRLDSNHNIYFYHVLCEIVP